MRKLLNLVLSASILSLTACEKPRENPAPSADLAKVTPTIKITRYSQSESNYSSLNRKENQDIPQFPQSEPIKPFWPY